MPRRHRAGLLLVLLLFLCRDCFPIAPTPLAFPAPSAKPTSSGPVQLRGRQLFVNGAPFQVRGVGYAPTPAGRSADEYDIYGDSALYNRDLPLLRAMHANTVRTWAKLASHGFLQAAYNGGDQPIYALMGFWVEPTGDLSQDSVRESISAAFRAYVAEYKDEPAVLMWCVGNEVNRVYGGDKRDWYSLLNELARVAYEVEGADYHPVTTANWEITNIGEAGSADADLPYLDAWGVTAYRGRSFGQLFNDYAARSAKPLLLAEYGVDAWDHWAGHEDAATQADYAAALWDEIDAHRATTIGGALMAYSDEWWKAGDPARQNSGGYPNPGYPDFWSDEEYYGIMRIAPQVGGPDKLTPRPVYAALRLKWSE